VSRLLPRSLDPLNSDALRHLLPQHVQPHSPVGGLVLQQRRETWERVLGEIIVPLNVLSVATTGVSKGIHAVVSAGKLYDLDNNTFTWTQDLSVEVVYIVPFRTFRRPPETTSSRTPAPLPGANSVGSEALYKFERDRMFAIAALLMREQRRTSQPNMLTDSWSVARVQLGRMGGSVRIL
jgi:hypothetical protein